jgi:hypothetical protein
MLKLDLENLQVESFLTSSEAERVGTVNGYQDPTYSGLDPACVSLQVGSCAPSDCVTCTPPSET